LSRLFFLGTFVDVGVVLWSHFNFVDLYSKHGKSDIASITYLVVHGTDFTNSLTQAGGPFRSCLGTNLCVGVGGGDTIAKGMCSMYQCCGSKMIFVRIRL
jgi:hypothetical protein